jgi:hypothetical protein
MKTGFLTLAATCFSVCTGAGSPVAHAAPDDKPPVSLNGGVLGGGVEALVDYGFCSGPQNAHAYPPTPVKIVLDNCNGMSQRYTSTSVGPSAGHNCGGYAVAFGPLGHLNPQLHQVTMVAEWGDAPLTDAQACGKARVTALAWGERCLDETCSQTTWDKLGGGPKRRHGKWDAATGKCTVEATFTSVNLKFKTLNLDVIADYPQGNQRVRKKAKATITAEKKGNCVTTIEVPAAKQN